MMKKKVLWRGLIAFWIIILVMAGIMAGYVFYKYTSGSWYEKNNLIAHAMGGIDKEDYTNSLEAFELNYEKGYRVFEVDLIESADGILVGRHGWKSNSLEPYTPENIPTAQEFLSNPTYGSYTPVSILDLLKLAQKYPDIYIMTDCKQPARTYPQGTDTKAEDEKYLNEDMKRVHEAIFTTAEEAGLTQVLKEQFIIQIYNEDMFVQISEWIDPERVVYTLYKTGDEDIPQAVEFCKENKIPVMTINQKRWTEEIRDMFEEAGIVPAVHTLNKKKKAKSFLEDGVKIIYTDYLNPSDFRINLLHI